MLFQAYSEILQHNKHNKKEFLGFEPAKARSLFGRRLRYL
jgi:hypothetical protein